MPIPASNASGYPNAAFRYRQAGHLYIQPRDFASGSDPCKQGIRPDIRSIRSCSRYRQAMHLSHNFCFAVTGKLGIYAPNTKNDRFPEIGKRSFCLPGLLGKSLKPFLCRRHSCAISAKSLPREIEKTEKPRHADHARMLFAHASNPSDSSITSSCQIPA